MTCFPCEDTRWVCEAHDEPWLGERACSCGGAGAPCPDCNKADLPRMPPGFKVEVDKEGWRQ
jgi:hypothetical protein